jgi:DNA polymerase bacteriophage-type
MARQGEASNKFRSQKGARWSTNHTCFFDFESYSLINLKERGLDIYAKDKSTGVSCLAWAFDQEDVQLWTPHLGSMPLRLLQAFSDPQVTIVAWNAAFERNILKHVLHIDIPIERFRDPIVLSHALSLPGKLELVAEILKMKELKDPRGKELVKMFSSPVHAGGESTLFGISTPLFRDRVSHPKEFLEYQNYCIQDVKAERAIWYRLSKVPFPETQWKGWFLDQKINEFGMPGRRDLAEKSLRLATRFVREQNAKLKTLTKLENPNSDTQFKAWAAERGYPWNSLRAPLIKGELDNPASPITAECREAMLLRKSARRSSYKKLEKFLALLSDDDRLRYQFSYMGAARTGRWKSGGKEDEANSMQVQNMSRGEKVVKKKLDIALRLIETEDYGGLVRKFPETTVVEVVITILRSLFQAKPGNTLIVADKNAIETRMLGWAAGCDAILDIFRHTKEDGGDPYLAFGTKLYNKTYAEMWKTYATGNEEERQNSKAPMLAAGYGLGGGELYTNSDGDEVRGGLWGYAKSVVGVDMPKELAHKAVQVYRDSYPEVVQLWIDSEEAFKQVLRRGGVVKVGEVTWNRYDQEWVEHPTHGKQCVLAFCRYAIETGGYIISVELPSGRRLHYYNATIDTEEKVSIKTGRPYTAEVIHFDGVEHSSTQNVEGKTEKKQHKWGRVKSYGSKLVENFIQAMSRDDLLESMLLADEMGIQLWATFHDELAAEVPKNPPLGEGLRLEDLLYCMTTVPSWANGLLLGADGFTGDVYRK